MEVDVYDGDALVAVSYFDVGAAATSSVYCMWKPAWRWYELGKFTLLKEIEWAIQAGMNYHYTGYGHLVRSVYDYKLEFGPFEWLEIAEIDEGWRDEDSFRVRRAEEMELTAEEYEGVY